MRAPSFVLAVAVALAALGFALWSSKDDGTARRDGGRDEVVQRADDGDAAARAEDDDAGQRLPVVDDVGATTTPDATPDGIGVRTEVPRVQPGDLVMMPFRGEALIQREDDRPRPVTVGTLSMEVWLRGGVESIEAPVANGRFEAEIPSTARVKLTAGTFDGERVRFPGLERPFEPSEDDHAIVGIPFPTNVLRVVDGGQRSPVTGVRIRRAANETAPLLAGQVDEGEIVVDDGVAPVILPWIDSPSPVHLRVTAPGYAPATVLVDPSTESDKEVALWPSADLVVRVTGEGRDMLRALVLLREEGGKRTPIAGMFRPNDPGVKRDGTQIVFDLKGVAGLPHRIIAKGYNGKGRTIDLAETRVQLGPGAARDVRLSVPAPPR